MRFKCVYDGPRFCPFYAGVSLQGVQTGANCGLCPYLAQIVRRACFLEPDLLRHISQMKGNGDGPKNREFPGLSKFKVAQ